eukprot:8404704-Pyramimonas_sp.AAC.1
MITGIDLQRSGASAVESRARNSVCCPNQVHETIRIVRVILRGALGFLRLTRAVVGCRASNDRNRFGDIRRVRLSHLEV